MKKRLIIISVAVGLMVLLMSFLLTNVFCWSGCYKNNSSLDKKVNNQIKHLLLNAMKDYWTKLYTTDKNELYTEGCIQEYLPAQEYWGNAKNWVIIIDRNFMDTVTERSGEIYEAYIQASYPEDYRFYYRIEVIDGQYMITQFMIDP